MAASYGYGGQWQWRWWMITTLILGLRCSDGEGMEVMDDTGSPLNQPVFACICGNDTSVWTGHSCFQVDWVGLEKQPHVERSEKVEPLNLRMSSHVILQFCVNLRPLCPTVPTEPLPLWPSHAVVTGGFEEATVTCRFTERVFLKTRAGFIKYALRHGYDLVPCFTVGDSDMFQGWKERLFFQVSICHPQFVLNS